MGRFSIFETSELEICAFLMLIYLRVLLKKYTDRTVFRIKKKIALLPSNINKLRCGNPSRLSNSRNLVTWSPAANPCKPRINIAEVIPISATPNKSRKARNVFIIKTRKSLKRSFFSKRSRTFLISVNLNKEVLEETIVTLYPINSFVI
mgnify:CR=1 FL=1